MRTGWTFGEFSFRNAFPFLYLAGQKEGKVIVELSEQVRKLEFLAERM